MGGAPVGGTGVGVVWCGVVWCGVVWWGHRGGCVQTDFIDILIGLTKNIFVFSSSSNFYANNYLRIETWNV